MKITYSIKETSVTLTLLLYRKLIAFKISFGIEMNPYLNICLNLNDLILFLPIRSQNTNDFNI